MLLRQHRFVVRVLINISGIYVVQVNGIADFFFRVIGSGVISSSSSSDDVGGGKKKKKRKGGGGGESLYTNL